MNENCDSIFETAPNIRSNTDIELAVTRGLAAAFLKGTPEGIRIMHEEGVPDEIITRVLKNNAHRRSSDWKVGG